MFIFDFFSEYAVTTNEEIQFFSKNWTLQRTAAHQFNDLTAITFDDVKDVIYFSDHSSPSGRLFSLRVSEDDQYNYQIQELMKKQLDERIQGVTFDPVSNVLYWTDQKQQQIYSWNMNESTKQPKKLLTFGDEVPTGISVDYCRNRLYWTNTNGIKATIESSDLDGNNHKVLISKDLTNPNSIVVDPFDGRLYWTDVNKGSYFKLESSALDGSDRKVVLTLPEKEPSGLAVDVNSIYLTEPVFKEIIQVNKKEGAGSQKPVASFTHPSVPKGIIVHNYYVDDQQPSQACKAAINAIHRRAELQQQINQENEYCLNGGKVVTGANKKTGQKECQCLSGFSGRRCERDLCSGFCFNGGTCVVNGLIPSCKCSSQYEGANCEVNKCRNFCLNGGKCSISPDGAPVCSKCDTGFTGKRCELDYCSNYCQNGGVCNLKDGLPVCSCSLGFRGPKCTDPVDKKVTICQELCSKIDDSIAAICEQCTNLSPSTILASMHTSNKTEQEPCTYSRTGFNKSLVFTSFGVMGSFALLLLIIITVYKIYKPARPRIKKTYVVKKNTQSNGCRSPATEQCEIIIENCCNMNICETPCFDPKMLQNETGPQRSKKDDKKELLKNMELNGELY